jgi:hypothetical protein
MIVFGKHFKRRFHQGRVNCQGLENTSTRALLAGNIKQLQEIRLNEDLLLKV